MASSAIASVPFQRGLPPKSLSNALRPTTPLLTAPFGRSLACHRASVVVWASEKGDEGIINEDVIARLKSAEEEAAKLRQELSEARKGSELMDKISEDISEKPPAQDEARESLFERSASRRKWLSETDLDFLIGEGPGERAVKGVTKEEEAIVQRRLLIGVGASLAIGALALIPSDVLEFRPRQPLQSFLVPILRSQDLLEECGPLVEDAEWDQVALVLNRIQKTPNNIRQNLEGAVAYMDTRTKRETGLHLAQETMEHLEQMDFQKYFNDFRRPGREGGNKNSQYVEFTSKALKATKASMKEFLALLPKEEIVSARSTIPSAVN